MRKLLYFALFFVMGLWGYGQKSYLSIHKGSSYSMEQLTNAIQNANWCGYFHISANYEIRFDDGSVVQLKNKAQLNSGNTADTYDENCFQDLYIKSEDIHTITNNGWITIPKDKVIRKPKSN